MGARVIGVVALLLAPGQIAGLALALCGAVLIPLHILNLTQHGLLADLTLRHCTKAVWVGGAVWCLWRPDPVRSTRALLARVARLLGHRHAFSVIAVAMLAYFTAATVTMVLGLRAGSDDFGMMDEALAGESGGRFMHSEVFGFSFLQEHFYLIEAALIPLRRALGTPWVTVVAQLLIIWAGIFPLRALLRRAGLPPWFQVFGCLMVMNHPIVGRSLTYLGHPETFDLTLILAVCWALEARRNVLYCLFLAALLAVKEDVGLYLAGFGVFVAVARDRPRLGLATTAVSLVWVAFVLLVAMPYFGAGSSPEAYRFAGRWAQWGSGPAGVLVGWLTHPLAVAKALSGKQQILLFAGLGFLPFISRWGWLAFMGPWVLNATSALWVQSGYTHYYGMPVLAFATVAAIHALRGGAYRWIAARRWAPLVPVVVAVLNVAHMPFEPIWPGRAAIIAEVSRLPRGAKAQVQPALYCIGGYWAGKTPLKWQRGPEDEWVVLFNGPSSWPLKAGEAEQLARRLVASGRYRDESRTPGVFLLHRAVR